MKRMINYRLKRAFLSLLGLLITVAIICILAFTAFKFYFKKPILDKLSEKFVQEQNINTTSYQSILSSTKDKLQKATQAENEHANEVEGMQ